MSAPGAKSAVLLGLLLLSVAPAALAQSVRLTWDPSPTVGVTNYVVYAHTNHLTDFDQLKQATARIPVGTNLTCTIESVTNGLWYFVATGQKNGIESGPSNEAVVEFPSPPPRMRVVVVQYSGVLTNFYDVGFFRLRLP